MTPMREHGRPAVRGDQHERLYRRLPFFGIVHKDWAAW